MNEDDYSVGTDEWVLVNPTLDGVLTTTGVSASIVPQGSPAGTWTPCTVVRGYPAIMFSPTEPGTYHVRAKVTTSDETPVIDCGIITVIP